MPFGNSDGNGARSCEYFIVIFEPREMGGYKAQWRRAVDVRLEAQQSGSSSTKIAAYALFRPPFTSNLPFSHPGPPSISSQRLSVPLPPPPQVASTLFRTPIPTNHPIRRPCRTTLAVGGRSSRYLADTIPRLFSGTFRHPF